MNSPYRFLWSQQDFNRAQEILGEHDTDRAVRLHAIVGSMFGDDVGYQIELSDVQIAVLAVNGFNVQGTRMFGWAVRT